MPSLYYPQAIQRPGPAWKVRGVNQVRGFCGHSAEGFRAGLLSELARTDRGAAWHCSVLFDGTVWQHYPFNNALWHGGSVFANYNLIGVEHEGTAGTPLTDAQRVASVSLAHWLAVEYGWAGLVRSKTLFEHREVADTTTQCPSGRIEWTAYTEEPVSNAYIVEPGDTLGAIAQRFGQTVPVLANRNRIANPDRIEVGQVLRLTDDAPEPHTVDVAALRKHLKAADDHLVAASEAHSRERDHLALAARAVEAAREVL